VLNSSGGVIEREFEADGQVIASEAGAASLTATPNTVNWGKSRKGDISDLD
jgi:hypothetical protein